ncbi:MAG: hypothetical protein IKG86_02465 [Paludibacteraceae bacterium]|nr:hypothetical protein [Paludibacteraceae bacterium]
MNILTKIQNIKPICQWDINGMKTMKKFFTTIIFFAFALGMHAQKFDFEYKQMQVFIEKADKEIKKLGKRVDSPEISTKEREKVYNEYKQLKRFRYVIQKRLDKLNRKRPQ